MWEIKQRVLVDMAADRGAFIDQSQSFNVHMSDPNFGKLTSLHFHAWRPGLTPGARRAGGRGQLWCRPRVCAPALARQACPCRPAAAAARAPCEAAAVASDQRKPGCCALANWPLSPRGGSLASHNCDRLQAELAAR